MKRPVHARTVPAFWNRGDILSLLPPEERPVETWTAHYSFKSRKHVVELSGQRQAPSRGSLPLEAADTFLASLSGTLERRLPCPGCLWPGRRPFKLHFADRESPLAKGGVWGPPCTASWPFVPHASRHLSASTLRRMLLLQRVFPSLQKFHRLFLFL